MRLSIGTTLQGRYRIAKLLGRGGMGAVYRAWDVRLEVPVALKEMIPQPGLDTQTLDQLRQQFRQEATVLARMDHPHLVRVTDFFVEEGSAYLVMKFIKGESLAQRIRERGVLSEKEVLRLADQLLDALAYCHSQGIIHRDVKPQNVIIRPDGEAVLVDFGLVKLWDPEDPHTRTVMQGMGTPEYAPPEQYGAQVGHTDARSDVYSLGATLYHALTGRLPPTATQRVVDPTVLPSVRAMRRDVSPRVEAAVMHALELQPARRFQSAGDMKAALREGELVQRVGGAKSESAAASTARREPLPRAWIGLVGLAAVLALVILGGAVLGAVLLFGDGGNDRGDDRVTASAVIAEVSDTPTETRAAAITGTNTPTLTPVASAPTETPEPSPTPPPRPTETPQPTYTPLPTETPTPTCPPVQGAFASIWQENQERLGCAVNQSHTTSVAEQNFDRGRMFWRKDTDRIYVLYDSGRWSAYQDIWQEGDPDYACPESAPQDSPPTPIRGFGKIWCTYTEVRDGLGWATDHERGYDATAQDFESGSIIRTDRGKTYVLYGDGTWER